MGSTLWAPSQRGTDPTVEFRACLPVLSWALPTPQAAILQNREGLTLRALLCVAHPGLSQELLLWFCTGPAL